MIKRKAAIFVFLSMVVLLVGACAGPSSVNNAPTNTPMPTNTPAPTNSPVPTGTPVPTCTPTPIIDARINEVLEIARDMTYVENTVAEFLTTKEAVDDYIYAKTKERYTPYKFPVFVSGGDLLRPEEDYLAMWSGLGEMKYAEETVIYQNGVLVKLEFSRKGFLEEADYAVYCALDSGDTSRLTSEEMELYDEVKKVAASCAASTEYETVKNVHDYLVLNIVYELKYRPVEHSAYGALINKACVCDGYATAFSLVLRELKIDTIMVEGIVDGESEINHAWNKVKIDNEWYNVDVTWDDPDLYDPDNVWYSYFCITDEELAKDHVWENENLPKAEADKILCIQ